MPHVSRRQWMKTSARPRPWPCCSTWPSRSTRATPRNGPVCSKRSAAAWDCCKATPGPFCRPGRERPTRPTSRPGSQPAQQPRRSATSPRPTASAMRCWPRASCSRTARQEPHGKPRSDLCPVCGQPPRGGGSARWRLLRKRPLRRSLPPPWPAPPDPRPGYWVEACKQLMKKDGVMKRRIPQSGNATLQTRRDAFTTLARSIVGQQISVKAAQTVWERLALLSCSMKPANVLKLRIDDMRAAGLSARKVDYLVDLSMHFESGQLHVKDWAAMDDEAIIAELIANRGIGRWTAEMFLIFYLMRPNVLPLDDLGLINGISLNYFSGAPVSRSDAREVAQAWKPWCSVATWYIWRSLDPLPVVY